jgi:4-hydroxybenzoate polyprenyltransferase
MSMITASPSRPAWPARLFFAIPIIGTIAREVLFGDKDNIWYALVIVLTALILSIAQWGLAALVMFYLPFVALAFVTMVVFAKPW